MGEVGGGRGPRSPPCSTASCITATCSSAARGAGGPKRRRRIRASENQMRPPITQPGGARASVLWAESSPRGKAKGFVTVEEKGNWLGKKQTGYEKKNHLQRASVQRSGEVSARDRKVRSKNLAREVPGEVKQVVPDARSTGRF